MCYWCLATFPNHKSCVSRRLAFSFAELFVPWKALGLRLRASLWEKTCIVAPPGPSCLDKQKFIEFLAQDLHVASCGIMWHLAFLGGASLHISALQAKDRQSHRRLQHLQLASRHLKTNQQPFRLLAKNRMMMNDVGLCSVKTWSFGCKIAK